MRPPEIKNSTEEERRQYIKNTFRCIADCDMCGLCTGGKTRKSHMQITSVAGVITWMYRRITDKPSESKKDTNVPVLEKIFI